MVAGAARPLVLSFMKPDGMSWLPEAPTGGGSSGQLAKQSVELWWRAVVMAVVPWPVVVAFRPLAVAYAFLY